MIVELRRYRLVPGARERLIEIFERNFVAGQEARGIRLLGRFRDLDRPDLFFWVRAFPENASRGEALASFYGGPEWREHREAANATMLDSDDVLQLRPLREGRIDAEGPVVATVCYLAEDLDDAALLERFDGAIAPQIEAAGGEVLAVFATDRSENVFPALPVREGLDAFVWFARYDAADAPQPDLDSGALPLSGTTEFHRLAHL